MNMGDHDAPVELTEEEWQAALEEVREEYERAEEDGCECADAGKCFYCVERTVERAELRNDELRDNHVYPSEYNDELAFCGGGE